MIVADSGARSRRFETYHRRLVSLSKTLYSQKVLVIFRKLWLRPNMTVQNVDWDVKAQHTHKTTLDCKLIAESKNSYGWVHHTALLEQ